MEQKKNSEMEYCALCGEPTGVLKSTPIEFRNNYVYGAGQLCYKCANEIRIEEELINPLRPSHTYR